MKCPRELRLLITARCNYRCMFCHHEGMRVDNKPNPSPAALLAACHSAMVLGYNDITLSANGEPLMCKDTVRHLLKGLSVHNGIVPPAITLVTNGSLLDQCIIADLAAYPGQLKMHVSLHTMNQDAYQRITGTRRDPNNILLRVRKAAEAGIKIKLSSVILKDINHTRDDLLAFIEAARDSGVKVVKFLELLVDQDHPELYPYFYSEEAVRRNLVDAGFIQVLTSMPRRIVMRHKSYPAINVEVQKCVCKFGCESCSRLRDRTIGPDLRYYPCFVHSREGVLFSGPDQMRQALSKGDKKLATYAHKYGRNSPILVRQDAYLKERWEVFFETKLSFEKCEQLLKDQKFHRSQIRAFTLHYCWPRRPSPRWTQFRRILNFGPDESNPNKVEFIDSIHKYRRQGRFLLSLQRFKEDSPPPFCESEQIARKQIAEKGFEVYMSRRFEIHDFEKGPVKLCLDKGDAIVNLKLPKLFLNTSTVRDALRVLEARPLRIPFEAWLMHNQPPKS